MTDENITTCRNCWGEIREYDGQWKHWPGVIRECPNGVAAVTAPGERSLGGVVMAEVRPHAAPGENPHEPWKVLPPRVIAMRWDQTTDTHRKAFWRTQFRKADGCDHHQDGARLRAFAMLGRAEPGL